MMNVLITGGYGFLGSNLTEFIAKNRFFGSRYNFLIPTRGELDLHHYEDLEKYCTRNSVDAIIHLAAVCGGIGANRENPGDFFLDNLRMSSNILRVSKEVGMRKVLTLGTVCSFPRDTPVPFKEDDLWNGYPEETNAPYGIAKKSLLVGGQALAKQYGINFIHLIPVNLFGPMDCFDLKTSHVIPAMLRKFHEAKEGNKEKVVLWGDGSASREFLFVEDCCRAIMLAFLNYDKVDPVNIGSGQEISIKDLAQKIKNIVGYEGEIEWDTSKPNGQPRRCLDVSRALKEFDFKAEIDLDKGLELTYNWAKGQK